MTEVVPHSGLGAEALTHLIELLDAQALTETSFTLDREIAYDEFEALCTYLGRMNRSCSWWIGDLLVYGEKVYGETYAQAADATGLAVQTLMNRAYVCNAIPPERRIAQLSFSTHSVVASKNAKEQTKWLKRAAKNGWTREQLVREIHDEENPGVEQELMPPTDGQEAQVVAPARKLAALYDQLAEAIEDGGAGYYRVPREPMNLLLGELGRLAGR